MRTWSLKGFLMVKVWHIKKHRHIAYKTYLWTSKTCGQTVSSTFLSETYQAFLSQLLFKKDLEGTKLCQWSSDILQKFGFLTTVDQHGLSDQKIKVVMYFQYMCYQKRFGSTINLWTHVFLLQTSIAQRWFLP